LDRSTDHGAASVALMEWSWRDVSTSTTTVNWLTSLRHQSSTDRHQHRSISYTDYSTTTVYAICYRILHSLFSD